MVSQSSEKQNLQYFQPDRLTGMLSSLIICFKERSCLLLKYSHHWITLSLVAQATEEATIFW